MGALVPRRIHFWGGDANLETLNVIVDMVKSVGFPIAMCMVFVYMWREEVKQHREESGEFAQAMRDTADAIAHNTQVIADLTTFISK